MARYETETHFWQIDREGAANTVTTGKRGNKGRRATKHHPTIGRAQAHHDELVREKLREGYVLVEIPAETPPVVVDASQRAELEDRLVDDPYDVEAYVVLGDLLQRDGDPRGELIALQLAAEGKIAGDADKARAAAGKYLARHATELWGTFAKYVADVRVVDAAPLIWRFGFIHRAELVGTDQLAILDELLESTDGRLLAELAVEVDRASGERVVATLARVAPPALRELSLIVKGPIDVRPLWTALPELERVSIMGREIEVGAIDLPNAKRFAMLAVLPNCEEVERIARAKWPALERLEMRLAPARPTSDAPAFEDIAPLLRRRDLPNLVQLRLRGAPYAGAILRALSENPLAGQLELIDLSYGDMSPADTAALVANASRFPNLREVWLPMRHLRPQDRAALTPLAKHVIGDERAPRDRIEELVGRL